MIKMVVSSFYNTIIDEEEAIPSSTIAEIDRIRKKGIIMTISTNRVYQEVLDYNKDFPFLDYIISLNGSFIYDVEKKVPIFKKKITKASIQKINKIFEDYNIIYYLGETITNNPKEDDDIYKIEIEIEDDNEIEKLSKLNVSKSILNIDNKKYIEITSNKATTFNATDQISLKNNIDLRDILVLCGNESDYSLVKNINNNYSVNNASKRIKDITKKIIPSNNDKGVESVLKEL